jgi:hypothetical protein
MFTKWTAAVLTYPIVEIPLSGGTLEAELALVPAARALLIFVGDDRAPHEPPVTRELAERMQRRRLSSLLPDLLTPQERSDPTSASMSEHARIVFLATRLQLVRDWAGRDWSTSELPVAYFGIGPSVAAAFIAAAIRPSDVFAVVAVDGRPDLAGELFASVTVPTLLLCGERNLDVRDINRQALRQLHGQSALRVVAEPDDPIDTGAYHDELATLAGNWLNDQLPVA